MEHKEPFQPCECSECRARSFGLEIRLARIKSGWAYQKGVAEKMGWHLGYLVQLERGTSEGLPSIEEVARLDDLLGARGLIIDAYPVEGP